MPNGRGTAETQSRVEGDVECHVFHFPYIWITLTGTGSGCHSWPPTPLNDKLQDHASPSHPLKGASVQITLGHPWTVSTTVLIISRGDTGTKHPGTLQACTYFNSRWLSRAPPACGSLGCPTVTASAPSVLPEDPCTKIPRIHQPVPNSALAIAPNNLSVEHPRNPWPTLSLSPTITAGCPLFEKT